jgi:hypothetical protein
VPRPPSGDRIDGVICQSRKALKGSGIRIRGPPAWSAARNQLLVGNGSADSLRWNLDLILDQRGADMADLPGGASGMLVRDYKRKEAGRLVTRIDPGVVAMAAELRGPERQAAEELEQGRRITRSAR